MPGREEFTAFGEATSILAMGIRSSRPLQAKGWLLSLISITNLCPLTSASKDALIHWRKEGRSLQPGRISAWGYLGIQPCYRSLIKG